MRIKHDNMCLWWKDWHSCSCGFLEEEARNQIKVISDSIKVISEKIAKSEICAQIIPGTFIMCGEDIGEQKQYCSDYCFKKAKGEK